MWIYHDKKILILYSRPLMSNINVRVCVVHSPGVYSLWSEWRMSLARSVQHGTGVSVCVCLCVCGLHRCQDLRHETCVWCQPRTHWESILQKPYPDNLSGKFVCILWRLLLQYSCASLLLSAQVFRRMQTQKRETNRLSGEVHDTRRGE